MSRDWPTRADLSNGIANRRITLTDPSLSAAAVRENALGLPQALSGANAVVFEFRSDTERWAVKCFIRPGPDRIARYEAISSTLTATRRPWSRNVEFQAKGMHLPSGDWPLLKMEWVDGLDLLEWLRSNVWEQARVAGLAERFATVVAELEAAGIAHGDLQHGNILVTEDDDLVLVDYDGMYVPALAAAGSCESGHPAYQSPRRANAWGPTIDRYSAWVIYGSLVAIAWDPGLLYGPDGAGEDRLLLSEADHLNLAASPTIELLLQHRLPVVRAVAEQLSAIGRVEPSDLLPLDPRRFPSLEGIGWWGEAPVDDSSWLDKRDPGALPPLAEPSLPTSAGEPAFAAQTDPWLLRLILRLAAVATAALAIALGPWALLAGGGATIAVGSIAFMLSPANRVLAQERIVMRAATERREICDQVVAATNAKARDAIDEGGREHAALMTMRSDVLKRAERTRDTITSNESKALDELQDERRNFSSRLRDQAARESSKAKSRRQQDAFAQAQIADARLPGIDAALVATLASAGITTAADITWGSDRPDRPITVGRGRRRSQTVELSPTQARVLGLWRIEVDPTLWGTDPGALRVQLETSSQLSEPLLEFAERETAIRIEAASARGHVETETARKVAEIGAAIDELRVRVTAVAQACARDRNEALAEAEAAKQSEQRAIGSLRRAATHGWQWWMWQLFRGPSDRST